MHAASEHTNLSVIHIDISLVGPGGSDQFVPLCNAVINSLGVRLKLNTLRGDGGTGASGSGMRNSPSSSGDLVEVASLLGAVKSAVATCGRYPRDIVESHVVGPWPVLTEAVVTLLGRNFPLELDLDYLGSGYAHHKGAFLGIGKCRQIDE